MTSFLADSLALGVHWIYDTRRIAEEFGVVENLLKPPAGSHHAEKDKGELTHYGDQTFVLLKSVASQKSFDANDFSNRWQSLFKDYKGYYDHATKGTLQNLSLGKSPEMAGSSSDDLAGASRVAPLVYCYRDDPDGLVEAARLQTMMTHNHPLVIDSAEFFARVTWSVLNGASPTVAMEGIAKEIFNRSPISTWVNDGMNTRDQDSVKTIADFGQSCHLGDAFPGVVHLIAGYENDLREALVQTVMTGGDSAARGMLVGMVLGAHLGVGNIPEKWLSEMKKTDDICALLDELHDVELSSQTK